AKLDRAILDQAWLVEADLSRASHTGASIFAAQMQRATLDGANLSGARITADLTGARLVGALLTGADPNADMENHTMGLMRAVLKSSNLERAILRDANLSRVDLEFASLKNADLSNASLRGAALGGATLAGVRVHGTDFNGADLTSTRLVDPIGLDAAKNFDKAQNIDRLLREGSAPRSGHDQCINLRRQEMMRGGVLLAGIAFGLVGSSVMAQDRKGSRFWNLTLYTITSFQMSPAGKDSWGPDQCQNDRDGTVDHDE